MRDGLWKNLSVYTDTDGLNHPIRISNCDHHKGHQTITVLPINGKAFLISGNKTGSWLVIHPLLSTIKNSTLKTINSVWIQVDIVNIGEGIFFFF